MILNLVYTYPLLTLQCSKTTIFINQHHLSDCGDTMPIVGFSFNKIDVERKSGVKGKININNNVAIKDVTEKELSFVKGQKGLEFTFEFSANYEPGLGHISFNGGVIYLGEEKQVNEIMSKWKKDKKVDKVIMTTILNHVLNKCNVQALILSQEIGLPPPIPLPKVEVKQPQ